MNLKDTVNIKTNCLYGYCNQQQSGSPPVLSISLRDHSFSPPAGGYSLACTLAHSTPLLRFMLFSKRAFNALSSASHCSGDNSFLFLLVIQCYFNFLTMSCNWLCAISGLAVVQPCSQREFVKKALLHIKYTYNVNR